MASVRFAFARSRGTACLPEDVGTCQRRGHVACATREVRSSSPRETKGSTASILALKEWNVAVEALASGDQTVLLRKGGIREPVFKTRSKEFLLFETSFHTEGDLLQPRIREKYAPLLNVEMDAETISLAALADVTGAWTTTDENVLAASHDLHVWSDEFLEKRLKWRQTQPITVLELRAYRFKEPINIRRMEEYSGCFSWVELEMNDASQTLERLRSLAVPALPDDVFEERQRRLRKALETLGSVEPLH